MSLPDNPFCWVCGGVASPFEFVSCGPPEGASVGSSVGGSGVSGDAVSSSSSSPPG